MLIAYPCDKNSENVVTDRGSHRLQTLGTQSTHPAARTRAPEAIVITPPPPPPVIAAPKPFVENDFMSG